MATRHSCKCGFAQLLDEFHAGNTFVCPKCGAESVVGLFQTLSQMEMEATESKQLPVPKMEGALPEKGSAARWQKQPGYFGQVIGTFLLGFIALAIVFGLFALRVAVQVSDPAVVPTGRASRESDLKEAPAMTPEEASRPANKFPRTPQMEIGKVEYSLAKKDGSRYTPREMSRRLVSKGAELAEAKEFSKAAAYEFSAIELEGGSRYRVAQYLALAGQPEEALYFLEQSMSREYVSPEVLGDDPSFAKIREKRPRDWTLILVQRNHWDKYFEEYGSHRNLVIKPLSRKSKKPLPLLIGLAESGSCPKEMDEKEFQYIADEQQVVIMLLGGPQCRGTSDFAWSNHLGENLAEIEKAIQVGEKTLGTNPKQVVLFGSGSGGRVALEAALSKPETFHGVIANEPSDQATITLPEDTLDFAYQGQTYWIFRSNGEDAKSVAAGKWEQDLSKNSEAKVVARFEVREKYDLLPSNFGGTLENWIDSVWK